MNRLQTFMYLSAIVFPVAFFWATDVQGHSAGLSWEKTDAQHVIDVGYDTDVFVAGMSARFDFSLKDVETKSTNIFSYAWVRIVGEKDSRALLATGVAYQTLGPTTLLYAFPQEGLYTLEVSFRDAEGSTIATASFPVVVTEQQKHTPLFFLGGVFLVTIATLLVFLFRKRAQRL